MNHICKIADVMDLVFSMNKEKTGDYISDYFLLEKFRVFENIVLMDKEYFKLTYDEYLINWFN